ncbi:phage integrase SAM-like domain-containing protein [Flavobacterium sp.]|uniref:phage integrase SAM-like domain-containing protein n=1 Tax=Flavobacterium sp. TaxID=239 RepID=UPI0040349052
MATIKFYVQSANGNSPIYLRLSIGRGKTFKQKTGQFVDAKNWSNESGAPKGRDEKYKKLKSDLIKLEGHVLDTLNVDNSSGILLNSSWLKTTIDEFYHRKEEDVKDYIVDYGDFYVESLSSKRSPSGKVGVSKDTVSKYKTIVDKLRAFEKYKKRRYLIKELNKNFRDDFVNYLNTEGRLSTNTTGRYITFVRTIILDAQKNGYEVSRQIVDFKGFTEDAPIITLSFNELEAIKNADLKDSKLEIARDWLIIGCYAGQRVSDLLRMNKKMIINHGGYHFISLKQEKTGTLVQVPIHNEVLTILDKRNGEFPPVFANTRDSNSTMFNRYLKELCQVAGLHTLTKGNLTDPITKVYGLGEYPKWMLVSSHICRRSFATNFYAEAEYPTPLLMNITGHATETMFLKYIGKKPMDYGLQLARIWERKAEDKKVMVVEEANL